MTTTDFRKEIDGQRWLEAQNIGGAEVPPFGVVRVAGSYFPDKLVPTARQVLQVLLPVDSNERLVAVNGPTRIKAHGFGQVTLDYPTYALYDAAESNLSGPWGTQAGSFTLKKGNDGFLIIGGATGNGSSAKARVVQSSRFSTVYSAAFRASATAIEPGQRVEPMVDVYRDGASAGTAEGVYYTSPGGFTFTQSGSYLVGFSTSVYSSSAPRGSLLSLALYLDETSTFYAAVRQQDIEEDQYGLSVLTPVENVATSGPLPIAAGQALSLRNTSAYPIVASPATLWACLLFPHAVTA